MSGPSYSRTEAKSVARQRLRGIITAPCVPVDAQGDIDEAGLRHDIRHLIDVIAADGLYMNGYYGHFWLMTNEQRRRVIEIAVDEAAGAVPIINRCAHPSPGEAIALARHSQDLGVDFVSLVIPQFGGAHKDVLLGYVAMIAGEIELGITIFNTDQAGYTLTPELMAELAQIPNVCALKNGLDLEHTAKIRALVGDSIVVVDPNEEHLMVNMAEHGQAAIYTGTNMMFDRVGARPMHDYVHAALAGDMDRAGRLFAAMQPQRDVHHRWVLEPWGRMGLCPVSTVKFISQQMGMTGGPTPRPLPDLLAPGDRDRLLAEMSAAGFLPGVRASASEPAGGDLP